MVIVSRSTTEAARLKMVVLQHVSTFQSAESMGFKGEFDNGSTYCALPSNGDFCEKVVSRKDAFSRDRCGL